MLTFKQKILDSMNPQQKRIYQSNRVLKFIDGLLITCQVIIISIALIYIYKKNDTISIFNNIFLILLGIFCLRFFIHTIINKKCFIVGYETILTIRKQISSKLLTIPLSSMERIHVGKVSNLLSDSLRFLELYITSVSSQICSSIGSLLLTFICVSVLDWRVSLVIMVIVVVYIFISLKFQNFIEKTIVKRSENLSQASLNMVEYIRGIQVIRSFNYVNKSEGEYEKSIDIMYASFKNSILKSFKYGLTLRLLPEVCLGFAILLSAYFYSNENIDMGKSVLIYMFIALSLASSSVLYTTSAITRICEAVNSKITNIMNIPIIVDTNLSQIPRDYSISFDKVDFHYEQNCPILKNINLNIKDKSVTAIVGSNGSGKSTLLKLITRFWDAQSGCVSIGGVDIKNIPTESLMGIISIVEQDLSVFNASLYENIAMGNPQSTKEKVMLCAKKAQIHDFIISLPNGYKTLAGENGNTLSGGQKQRLCIARALLKNAPILILDEVTNSIDPENEYLIQEALNELSKNKTVIIVSHKLSTLTQADQIIVLKNNSIDDFGTHEKLLKNSIEYKKLCDYYLLAKNWEI